MHSPKPFPEQLRHLAEQSGRSVGGVAYQAYSPDGRGTSPDTLRKVMAGKRKLNDALIEAVAEVLGVPPEVFVEYRLSKLRQSLDESVVGFSEAVARLELIEAALNVAAGTREERLAEGLVREIEALAQTVQGPSAAPAKGSRAS